MSRGSLTAKGTHTPILPEHYCYGKC